MKRIRHLVFILLVASLGLLAACAKNDHDHVFSFKNAVEATCETDGYRLSTCECGEKRKEVLPKTGHSYSFNGFAWDGF